MQAGGSGDLPRTELVAADAVRLGSAWLAHRAAATGVRVLFLKGPGAAHLELRPEKNSTDVDVLVEPGRMEELQAAAEKSGWMLRFSPLSPHLLEPHSSTLFHTQWPIDLDLHTYWPGFFADRREVFDELWCNRVQWSMAGVDLAIPDRISSALILALHALRRPRKDRREAELGALVRTVVASFSPDDLTTLLERATRFGAADAARPFLEALGLHPVAQPGYRTELHRWRLNARAKGYTDAWLVTLAVARWRERPAVLFRAIVPTEAEMRGLHPDIAPGRRALASARLYRLVRGLTEIPHALRSLSTDRH